MMCLGFREIIINIIIIKMDLYYINKYLCFEKMTMKASSQK